MIARVKFSSWDKAYSFACPIDCQVGDWVLVETEIGKELGKIISKKEAKKDELEKLQTVLRLANKNDWEIVGGEERKKQAIKVCQKLIAKHGLAMKLIDARFSYQANRLNFAFVADGRIDFRELVKDLGAHFNLNIRLTQIGTRDEAKLSGDCGPCGRGLCCRDFIKEFSSISSEMAECQQVVHRGSERISGACGRLMCCLGYEYEGYKELADQLPALGSSLKIDGRKGKVINHHVLKQTIDVLVEAGKNGDGETVIEVDPKSNLSKQLRQR